MLWLSCEIGSFPEVSGVKKSNQKTQKQKKHIWHPQLPYLEQVLQHSPANLQPYPRTCSRVRPQTPRDKMLRGSSKDVCQAIALDKVSAKRTTRRRVASIFEVGWDHLWEQGVVDVTYISNHLKSTGIKVGQTKTYKKMDLYGIQRVPYKSIKPSQMLPWLEDVYLHLP